MSTAYWLTRRRRRRRSSDLPWNEHDRAVLSAAATGRPALRAPLSRAQPGAVAPRTVLTFPTVFVEVRGDAIAGYADQPWAHVLAAAERGIDGLQVVTERPRAWGGRASAPQSRRTWPFSRKARASGAAARCSISRTGDQPTTARPSRRAPSRLAREVAASVDTAARPTAIDSDGS